MNFASTATDEGRSVPSAVFDAFGDERRLRTFAVLRSESAPINVFPLARMVAAEETGAAHWAVTDDRVREVRISLHHNHLPKLADEGLVEYDHEEGTVTAVREIEWLLR